MDHLEYLLSYGQLGDFGRFRAGRPLPLARGDRAVVRSHRGLEVAQVLRPATPLHAPFLPNTTVGQLLRPVTPEDEETLVQTAERAREVLARGLALVAEQRLPLELLDAEVLLDGEHVYLHVLRFDECDVRPFVSAVSREFGLHVALSDLTAPAAPHAHEDEHGCGREGCGGGDCGSCGSGGGCGTCGSAAPAEVAAHFAGLREQMEGRVPLL